jgi:uncharacterized protein
MRLRWVTRGLALLVYLSFGTSTGAQVQFPPKPEPDHFYLDMAGLIPATEEGQVGVGAEIDGIAGALLREEQIPLIVVTIPSLLDYGAAGYTVDRYATDLFNNWGIGSEQRNYGILLLVSLGDRTARIELGASWGRGHDGQAQEVMDTLIVPAFRRAAYGEGILGGVRGLDAMARGLALPRPESPWWAPWLMVALLVLVVWIIISLFKSGRSGWGWALIAFLGVALFFLLRSAASSGGSGGAFGGGSSGGGGASGSW